MTKLIILETEIGALAGGQLPHFRGAGVARSQTRSTYDENQLWKVGWGMIKV